MGAVENGMVSGLGRALDKIEERAKFENFRKAVQGDLLVMAVTTDQPNAQLREYPARAWLADHCMAGPVADQLWNACVAAMNGRDPGPALRTLVLLCGADYALTADE